MSKMSGAKKKSQTQPIKVYVRQRPFSEEELTLNANSVVQYITNTDLIVKSGLIEKKYNFDQVFREDSSQEEVYSSIVSPLIKSVMSGYNCTVFAYGQTGTGKTYTMIGNDFTGLIPRSALQLFQDLQQVESKIEHTVRVCFMEIYNEEVRDLLSVGAPTPLKIFDDPDNKGSVCIKGMKEVMVFCADDVKDLLNTGLFERQTSATNLNRQSSRSHSIFTMSVLTRQLTIGGDELIKIGKLYMVDLAGSENIGRSGSSAREAGKINKSLLTLGKIIKALAQKNQHIPYRDSKLTRILQDSFGGKTNTCMIATISATDRSWDETVSTLDYAQVARNVSNCPQVNENRRKGNVFNTLKMEISRLRKELAVARSGEGFYVSAEIYEKLNRDAEIDAHKKRNEELQAEIGLKEEQIRNLCKCYNEVRQQLEEKEHQNRRNEFIINYLDSREKELKAAFDQLWKVCEVSTQHEYLFFQKYKKLPTLKAYNLFGESLKYLQRTTENHLNSFSEIQADVACLRENAWKMCKCLSEYSKKFENSIDFAKINEKEVCCDLDKEFASQVFQTQRTIIRYHEMKIQEVELITNRCINSIKQMLNDCVLCVNDVIKFQSSFIQNLKNNVISDEVSLKEAVQFYKNKSQQFVQKLVTTVNENFTSHAHKNRIEFTTESENKVNHVNASLKSVEKDRNMYETGFKVVSERTLERIKNELVANLNAEDTPNRHTYSFPKKIDEKLSKEVLYRQFENGHF